MPAYEFAAKLNVVFDPHSLGFVRTSANIANPLDNLSQHPQLHKPVLLLLFVKVL